MANPDAISCRELDELPQPQQRIAYELMRGNHYPFTLENHSEAHGEACFRTNTPANLKYKAMVQASENFDDVTAGRLGREIAFDYWLNIAIEQSAQEADYDR